MEVAVLQPWSGRKEDGSGEGPDSICGTCHPQLLGLCSPQVLESGVLDTLSVEERKRQEVSPLGVPRHGVGHTVPWELRD